jgi:putative ABC transport system permease protein
MSVYRVLALRYLLQRWDRAALIVVSIALGVATIVSARILNQCIEAAAMDTTTPGATAELHVTNGEAGVQRAVADDLRAAKLPGVRSVQPLVYERVGLPDLDDRPAILVGAEVSTQLLTADNPLKAKVTTLKTPALLHLAPVWSAAQAGDFAKVGQLWDRIPARLVMVSKPVYDEWLGRTGGRKPFVVRYASREFECLPVGTVEFDPGSPLELLGRNFIGMSVGQAARVLRPAPPLAAVGGGLGDVAAEHLFPARLNRIDLFLEPGADRDAVARAAAAVVGRRADVRTPDVQRRNTQEIVSGLQIGVLMCSLGAMVVGLFLVYNAMAVTVAERRADIGILRSLGATRGQVVALFAAAAGLLGLVGAALGVPLGVLLAEGTLALVSEELASIFLNPDVSPTHLSGATAAVAVVVGVATAVFAALMPAVQAANADPAHVVRRAGGGAKGAWKLFHRLACAALLAAGVGLILFRQDLPTRVGGFGGMAAVLIGLLLAAPIFVGVLVSALRPLVRVWCPFELRLAFDNLSRAPGRTGVVIGALGAGVGLMVQTAGLGRSSEEPVVAWIGQVVQADHFVFSGNMTAANSSNSPMAAAVAADLKGLPGVEDVMTIRYSRPEFNGTIVYLVALDVATYAEATRTRVPEGAVEFDKFPQIDDRAPGNVGVNKVLVSDNFLARHGVRVGDAIAVPGPSGPVELLVVGAVRDYSWSRGTIFMDRARYARLFGDDLVDICHVFLRPDHPAAAEPTLEHYAAERRLVLTDRASLREFVVKLINRMYVLAYTQQVLVGVVAGLGVVTALLISVLQRKRELGLLLAVGATPGQVLRSVLAEAFLMGVFGTVLGVLIGLPMEWYVLRVMFVDESGFDLDVLVPWKAALGIGAASITMATLAGLIPAWRAIQTRIPDALQYE